MSVQVKRRRDTATNISTFTPAQGELIVDTTNNRVIVGDGATAGGWAAAKLSEVATFTGVTLVTASMQVTLPGFYAVRTAGVTLTLSAPWSGPGVVTVKDATGLAYPNIVISGAIDGSTSLTLSAPYEARTFQPISALNIWGIQ